MMAVAHTDSTAQHSPFAAKAGLAPVAAKRDSLAVQGADSVSAVQPVAALDTVALRSSYPFTVYCTADSLRHREVLSQPRYRDASAETVFGTTATVIQPELLPLRQAQPLTENVVFQVFVLLLAATYAVLLYRNLGDIGQLLRRVSREVTSGDRLTEEPGNNGFSRFLNLTAIIGLLFIGVVAVKYGDALVPRRVLELLSHGAVVAMSLAAAVAVGLIALEQYLLLRLVGAVTLSEPLVARLSRLKSTFFALAVIVTSPAALLFALCPHGTGTVWFYVVAIELLITLFLYLRETLNLFLSKKISILHWFLYLCTVEILPFSFLWLAAVR